jgi:uncharacterized membrane protein
MDILLAEPAPIPLHVIVALLAIVLGGTQLYMKKGTVPHKSLGWIWVVLILIVSFSSFFISEFKIWGPYSPIHLLSIVTIFSVGLAIYFVRIGNIKRHKRIMLILYSTLILTGLFTLLPGRVMHQIVFSQF